MAFLSRPIAPSSIVASLLAAAALTACSTPTTTPTAPRPKVSYRAAPTFSNVPLTQQERSAILEIQLLYSRGSYSDAIVKAHAFETRFPNSSRIPEVLNLKGLSMLLMRQPEEAASVFQLAIDKTPEALAGDRNWKNYVRYNLSAALLESGFPKKALSELAEVDPDSYDPANRAKFHQIRARAHEQLGNLGEAALEWIALSRQGQKLDLARVPVESSFESLLSRMRDRSVLEQTAEAAKGSSLAAIAQFYLIRKELDEKRNSAAMERAREFLQEHPSSPKADEVTEWMRVGREDGGSSELSIGLLIPQTGKFSRVGQRVLQGVSLALGIFGAGGGEASARIKLVVEDSGEDADSALQALERLHRKHRVAAVIGPILSKGAETLIAKAEDYGLPMISLAQQAGALGNYTFQGAVTPRLQAREIARHAVQTLGFRRFAILAPRDRFGEEYSQEFWNAVEELGGSVTAYETYTPGETDFRQSMDRLAGTYYADARKRELVALAKDREANQIKKRTRRTEKYFALPTIVEFEAVFIPDEPKAVGLALPTFTYRDIDGVRFLGVSSWNSPELIQRAQKSAEGALFVDSYFALSEAPAVRKFSERFRTAFGQEAGSLEAVAYDAAALLERAVSLEADKSGVSRGDVADRLRQIRDAPGVTGRITSKDGSWTRELKVLTIRDEQVTEASHPRSARPAD